MSTRPGRSGCSPSALGRRDLLRLAGGAAVGIGLGGLAGCGGDGGSVGSPAPGSRPRAVLGETATRPNVVAILADDMRFDELAAMPSVLALADRGVRFEQLRVPTPVCNPSRVAFLRGQLANGPNGTGVVSQQTGLTEAMRSEQLPRWLARAGYRCGIVGKYLTAPRRPWHDDGWSTIATTFGATPQAALGYELWDGEQASGPITDRRSEELLADAAVDFVDTAAPPWFLWWCSTSPHTPLEALPEDREAERDERWPLDVDEDVSSKPSWIRARPAPSAAAVAYAAAFQRHRQAELRELDRHVGRLVDHLDADGRLDRTVVAFWSDNGDSMLDHRLPVLGKGTPYDVSMRVPAILAGGGLPAGVSVTVPTTVQDLTATVVDLAGATAGVPQDGTSLLGVLGDPGAFADRAVLGHCGWEDVLDGMPASDVVVTADAKLIRYQEPAGGFTDPTDRFELYDLGADPGELVNLAWDPGHLAQREALEARLDSLLATGQG